MGDYLGLKEPSASVSLRIPRELWTKISKFVDDENFPDFSHAARSLMYAGLWLNENKKNLTDPDKSQKLMDDYNSKANEKDVFDWVKQLPDSKIQGIEIAFELEKERRTLETQLRQSQKHLSPPKHRG